MKKPLSPIKKKVHFIGIGGIGVSALARYFLSQGCDVSGSDAFSSEITDKLKKEKTKIFIGHHQSNIDKNISLIIHSAAIKKDNPEIIQAKKLNIPIKSYSEAIGELTDIYKTIAISGAHGKSTTTALASLILIKARFDPNIIIGTKLKEFNDSNFRRGGKNYLILEADEYHSAFLNYSPFAAIITNIDREHLDYYPNLAAIKNVFLKFIGNIQRGGILIVNRDDKNLFSLKQKIEKIAGKNNLKVCWYSLIDKTAKKLRFLLKVPGDHNISNAMAVYTLAKAFNIKENDIFSALSEYRGAWRRMEYRGEFRIKNLEYRNKKIKKSTSILNPQSSISIYDDYAHHPTEIKATLSAFRQKYPESPIICVFQPHQEKRLKALFGDFRSAFDNSNYLILLDIFKVKGRDEPLSDVNSEKLAEAIKRRKSSPIILYLKNPKNLKKEIKNILNSQFSILNSSAIIVMMGAGDIYKLTDKLVK